MRVFSFSEVYGPFKCEATTFLCGPTRPPKYCEAQAWDVLLTDAENLTLPEQSGAAAAKFILETGLGKMLCEDCLETEKAKLKCTQ